MRVHEVECFARALGTGPDGIAVVDALERVPDAAQVRRVRGVLLGGSGEYSCLGPEPWIGRMVGWGRDVLLREPTPVFASCFGFQVLVLALGGRMVHDRENQEVGCFELDRTETAAGDEVFGSLPGRFLAQVGHSDRADALPPGTHLLASSARCPVHAYRVEGRAIWATQFHPELTAADTRTRYLAYAARYPDPALPPGAPAHESPFLRSLRETPEASALLARFARFTA